MGGEGKPAGSFFRQRDAEYLHLWAMHVIKNRDKNTDFDPLFFSKKTTGQMWLWCPSPTPHLHCCGTRPCSSSADTSRPPTAPVPAAPRIIQHSEHFVSISSACYSIRGPDTLHIPQQTHLPTYLKATREDSSPRPQSTVAELPSGTKWWKTPICPHLNTT